MTGSILKFRGSDANKVLTELGKPGSLYFIAHKDAEGNENYTLDTATGGIS